MSSSNNVIYHGRLLSSTARLRTRSGCVECRRRRKKCDEKRPRCGGCTQNTLTCTWLAESQSLDRRRYTKSSGWRGSTSATNMSMAQYSQLVLESSLSFTENNLSPSVLAMPFPFQQEEYLHLYQYFAECVLPRRLVRQTSLSRYSDQKHMLRLAIAHPPLMGAIIAIAAMKERQQPYGNVTLALKSYIFTINSLRKCVARGKYTGTEDWLLATTVLLCVFENSRCDSMPNAGPHVLASGKLLSLRTPRSLNCSQAAMVFERVCVESFLYHAVLMTLFDSSLDCLSSILGRLNLDQYLSDPVHPENATPGSPASTQPILDASYKFYLLIVDVVWLARTSFSPKSIDYATWLRLRITFARWEGAIGDGRSEETDNHIGKLYTIGIRMLLVQANPSLLVNDVVNSLELLFQRGLAIIRRLDVQDVFVYYYLWPLVVVGSIAISPADRKMIEDKVCQVSGSPQEGSVALASHRLKTAWTQGTMCESRSLRILIQLQTILVGNSVLPSEIRL